MKFQTSARFHSQAAHTHVAALPFHSRLFVLLTEGHSKVTLVWERMTQVTVVVSWDCQNKEPTNWVAETPGLLCLRDTEVAAGLPPAEGWEGAHAPGPHLWPFAGCLWQPSSPVPAFILCAWQYPDFLFHKDTSHVD